MNPKNRRPATPNRQTLLNLIRSASAFLEYGNASSMIVAVVLLYFFLMKSRLLLQECVWEF